jgi:transposase-like protein
MPDPTVRLRRQARQFLNATTPTATRYSAPFRREVIDHARARVAEGDPVARIARELGLRPKVLHVWLRSKPRPALRRVRVAIAPQPPDRSVVVVTAAGVRVEGLDLEGAAKLLRLLS